MAIWVFPEDEPVLGLMGPWPLPDDRHFFDLPNGSPFVHTDDQPAAMLLIQAKVGASLTGIYDDETQGQVIAWRRRWMADEEEYVDLPAWLVMDVVPDPVPELAGSQTLPETDPWTA